MIVHLAYFLFGAICGGTAVALLVLASASAMSRPGQPPRDR